MFIALSGMFKLRTVTFDAPNIVNHHMHIPSTLITIFHNLQISEKSLTWLVANTTKILLKVGKMTMQIVEFNTHVVTTHFVALQ